MARDQQITIPARTNKSVVVTITSGLESLDGYTATMTVKKSVNRDDSEFTVTGSIDGLAMTFEITDDQSDISPAKYFYDVVVTDGSRRVPICKGPLVIELWASSLEEA